MSERAQRHRLVSPLASVEAFQDLPQTELEDLGAQLTLLSVARGETLVHQGAAENALYLVVSGRFQVYKESSRETIAEIGVGHPIGEIAFFSGGRRTASVRAKRDSLVLKLERADFERLATRSPAIWRTITTTLARRLAETTEFSKHHKQTSRPKTIAIIQAGASPIPELFKRNLQKQFSNASRCQFFDSSTLNERQELRGSSLESLNWFNELETKFELVFYFADSELTSWSRKVVRQADLVLAVGVHDLAKDGAVSQNAVEGFAFGLHETESMVLLLVHQDRDTITGTRYWLSSRPVHRHHHLVLSSLADYARLSRFIRGTALGLIACGGGSYSAAHIGLYQALTEAGLEFDFVGGASGGGAMTAAFATGIGTDEIDRRVHEIFVKSAALRRWTWPRYSFLDHTVFDRQLALHFGGVDIEDLWMPYFAASTNLTNNTPYYHRRGPLWEAVRATAAIPALLPPFFTAAGDMLVDGSILDNVPVAAMRSLKTGPNIIISFNVADPIRVDVDYRALPARGKLIWNSLNPYTRASLPPAPGPISVLVRSLMVSCRNFQPHIGVGDMLLIPPLPSDLNLMDWRSHTQLVEQAYEYGMTELKRLKSKGHPLLDRTF